MKKLRIIADPCAESPRSWDNLGTIAYKHSRYTLGDSEFSDTYEFLYGLLDLTDNQIERINGDFDKLKDRFSSNFIWLPVYLYDHSGITISTTSFNDRWDSGQIGFIYISKENARKEYGRLTAKNIERIEGYLRGEIETFDQFLRGDVYGFILENAEGEEIDSCWGFYGDDPRVNGMFDHISDEDLKDLEIGEIEY